MKQITAKYDFCSCWKSWFSAFWVRVKCTTYFLTAYYLICPWNWVKLEVSISKGDIRYYILILAKRLRSCILNQKSNCAEFINHFQLKILIFYMYTPLSLLEQIFKKILFPSRIFEKKIVVILSSIICLVSVNPFLLLDGLAL